MQNTQSYKYSLSYIIIFLPYFIIPFSPLFAYFFAMFLLLVLTYYYCDKGILYILGFAIAISGSLIWASRVYFDSDADDFLRYYYIYKQLLLDNYNAMFVFGGGYEVGFGLFYLALDKIFSELPEPEILFFTILVPSLLMVIWTIEYGIKSLKPFNGVLCLFFIFLFFNFYAPSEWSRQSFACVFILFAFSQEKWSYKIFFTFLASLFHLTSIPILILLECIKRKPRLTFITVFLGSLGFVFTFEILLLAYQNGFLPQLSIFQKLKYYMYYQDTGIFDDINISFLFLLFCIFILMIIPNKKDSLKNEWKYFFFVFISLYIIFLPIHYASNRLTLIFNSFLLGYMFFISIHKFSIFGYVLGLALLIFKFLYYWFNIEHMLWFSYPPYGNFLYYFHF